MFDDEEYAALSKLIGEGMSMPLSTSREQRFKPMSQLHKQLTGREETNPNAVGHHLLSRYGLPCTCCGKPLRTPRARFCAACGQSSNPAQD